MGRKKQQDSILDDAFALFTMTPFWVGPLVAAFVFVLFRYLFPLLFPPKADGVDMGIVFRQMFPALSWIAVAVVLIAWIAAEISKLSSRRVLDQQTGIDSVRSLSWSQFERLVGEYYRRQGYLAEVVGSAGGDGGVDIVLNGEGERVLVQCKNWKAFKVGVQPVRELLGVVTARGAPRGILVTPGRLTVEARQFAGQTSNLELVDGDQLQAMIQSVQSSPANNTRPVPVPRAEVPIPLPPRQKPSCPACGSQMVLRTAKRGVNAGSQFWGCPSYPSCRGTQPA